ncbi:hypothetical protein [Lichenihabitans psoromatis]|nr:hypothetical protein [Lichenihabitans psoromatis]
MAIAVATMLASFPLIIGFVQATSKARQRAKLAGLAGRPVAKTAYYAAALAALYSLRPATVTSEDYRMPMSGFCITVVICSLAVFIAYDVESIHSSKSIVLGGMDVVAKTAGDPEITRYQSGTFTCIAYAFVGAYVCIISRLLSRINNNDIYPISFHFYSAWIISAGLVAAVLRHVMHLLFSDTRPDTVILLGFATGLSPNLFLVAIARRAFN